MEEQEGADPWRPLFTGPPRLGWAFRDRRELIPAYQEPKPGPGEAQAQAAARVTTTEARFTRAWKWAGRPSIGIAVILVLLSSCARAVGGGGYSPVLTLVTAGVLCLPGLGYTGWCWLERDKARDLPPEQAWQQAVGAWERRAAAHADAELAKLASVPEWGSVPAPPGRTDVFGGTLPGWQALVTVHGASLLAGRPLMIADLTGHHVAAPLLSLAQHAGIGSVDWHLPADLARSGILNGLPPDQLAAAIADALHAEAMHAEALHAGTPASARTERTADTRIMRQLAEVLAPAGLTMPRLAAAVRAALGHPPEALLTPEEREAITGTLFPPGGARELSAPGLARLNAVLPVLAARSGDGWPVPPSPCTCITLDAAARGADSEVLATLLIQWLTVQAAAAPMFPALIVAGAEEIPRPHAERLSNACELRGVPLTLMFRQLGVFRHLRDAPAEPLAGAAATAFMRLSNQPEAERAAIRLGRHRPFTMSSPDPQGTRRGYEYRIDPALLQNLPDHALLLADRAPGPPRLRAVECDPSIITLPHQQHHAQHG